MVKLTFTFLLMVGHIFAIVSCDENNSYYDGRSYCQVKGLNYISSSCRQGGNFDVSCRDDRGRTHNFMTGCPGVKTCRYSTKDKEAKCVARV